MAWSPQQDAALRAIRQWQCDRSSPQVFYLAGYAGTGKTTLAKQIAQDTRGEVIFAAFTGKAALVLRQKGCDGARTIHSLIYRPVEMADGPPTFELNERSDGESASLIIVDECSMVDETLARDLLSFGTPVLVLGDPAQLPPVKGLGFFTDREPDFVLTEIHRQAADNPIIHMSMKVREGRTLQPGRYGDSEVIAPGVTLDADRVMAADQMLVGRNATRLRYNARFREVRGIASPMPVAGDKLVCLRNDKDKGLLNGGLWNVRNLLNGRGASIRMAIQSDDGQTDQSVSVRTEFFTGQEGTLDWSQRRRSDEFAFGYALTVHKSQGSQWDDVVLFDESPYFREHRARHLYTGLTRAAQKVTVVQ
jgi:exodeoxyribonuclease-5